MDTWYKSVTENYSNVIQSTYDSCNDGIDTYKKALKVVLGLSDFLAEAEPIDKEDEETLQTINSACEKLAVFFQGTFSRNGNETISTNKGFHSSI